MLNNSTVFLLVAREAIVSIASDENPLRDTIPILSSTRCDVIIPSGAIE